VGGGAQRIQTNRAHHIPCIRRCGGCAPHVELLLLQADLQQGAGVSRHSCHAPVLWLTCSVPMALSIAAAMSPRRACCCSSCSCIKVSA